MPATLLLRQRIVLDEAVFVEMIVWRVPSPVRGSDHAFKYSLAYVETGACVLRYDNEPGKGDHRHEGATETAYTFVSVDRLIRDFWADVDARRKP